MREGIALQLFCVSLNTELALLTHKPRAASVHAVGQVVCAGMCVSVCVCRYMYVCVCRNVCPCACICVQVCVYLCVHACVFVCAHMCVQVHVCVMCPCHGLSHLTTMVSPHALVLTPGAYTHISSPSWRLAHPANCHLLIYYSNIPPPPHHFTATSSTITPSLSFFHPPFLPLPSPYPTPHTPPPILSPVLDVAAFERLLGPCMDIMKRNFEHYEEQLMQLFGTTMDITDYR